MEPDASAHQSQNPTFGDVTIQGDLKDVSLFTFNQTQIIQIAVAEIKTRPLNLTSPYKGLKKFEPGDKDLFFGRDQFLTGLVHELEQTNFILLLGASGSGKSSVIRAGLIPWLQQQHGSYLVTLLFTPDQDPFESLHSSLLQHGYKQAAAQIARSPIPHPLSQVVHTLKQPDTYWLILIDQFEELFTTTAPEKRDRFITSLALLCQTHHADRTLKIIATMRSDFLDRLDPAPANLLARITDRHRPLITQMHPDELRLAIEQPAAHHGVVFETGLVEEIIRDVQGQAGYLPLLQYTLNLLWETEVKAGGLGDRTLRIPAYHQLGGVRGALQQHVDQVYATLSPPEQLAAQRILLKLVEVGANEVAGTDWKPVRRRALRAEFAEATEQQVLLRFINENLLVSNRLPDKSSAEPNTLALATVEIAHEVLLTSWPQLNDWIQANRQALADRSRIYKDLQEWQTTRADEDLLRGSVLERALELRKDATFQQVLNGFDETTNHFINVSASLRDRQRRQRARLRRRIMIGLTLASILITAIAVFAGLQWIEAEKQFILSTSKYSTVLAQSDQGFNALIAGLRAGKELQRIAWTQPDPQVKRKALMALEDALYGVREVNTLEGHTGTVYGVSFSPDDQTLASAGEDGTLKLWNPQGKLLKTLTAHSGSSVYSVSFSPDGKTFASANADGTIELWSRDGALRKTLTGHSGAVYQVRFNADGQILASASADKTIKLWRSNGELLNTLTGHTDTVNSISFSPDGRMLASASADKTIKLWRPDGTLLKTVTAYNRPVLSVHFSPDSQAIVATSEDGTMRLWNQNGEELKRLFLSGIVYHAIFSPDGKTIASGGGDTTVQLWGTTTTLKDANSSPANPSPAQLPESIPGMITDVVPLQTWQGNTEGILNLAFSSDGQILAATSQDGTIKLWKRNSIWAQTLQGHASEVDSVVFSPDGQLLASASEDQTIKLWSRKGQLLKTLTGHTDVIHGIRFSPDGQTLASASWDKTIKLWRVTDGQPFKTFTGHTGRVYGIDFSPDGQTIASSSNDGTVKLWDRNGTVINTLSGHTDVIHNVRFSPDGQRLASSSHDKTVKIWQVRDGKLLTTLRGHTNWVHQVDFSPDGKLLVSASWDRTTKLWRVEDGQLLHTFIGHTDKALGASFSPNGQMIASSSEDKTAKLWKLDGALITTLRGHIGRVHNVSFSPDGNTLASASYDSTIILWDLKNRDNVDNLVAKGCDWARDYLNNNSTLSQTIKVGTPQEVRHLCH